MVLKVPRRGHKRELVQMAAENAAETLTHLRSQWQADESKQNEALAELQEALGSGRAAQPHRVLRHLHAAGDAHRGQHGGLCQGRAAQERLSPFQDQGVQGQDDFASMHEVLRRRFKRMQDAAYEAQANPGRARRT